jgi:hypothetical protein
MLLLLPPNTLRLKLKVTKVALAQHLMAGSAPLTRLCTLHKLLSALSAPPGLLRCKEWHLSRHQGRGHSPQVRHRALVCTTHLYACHFHLKIPFSFCVGLKQNQNSKRNLHLWHQISFGWTLQIVSMILFFWTFLLLSTSVASCIKQDIITFLYVTTAAQYFLATMQFLVLPRVLHAKLQTYLQRGSSAYDTGTV